MRHYFNKCFLANKPEHQRLASIPLPQTVTDALIPVKKQDCVSHAVKLDVQGEKGPKTESGPELTSANHAFYVGKMIPQSFGSRIKRLLGWGNPEERIYNPQFIEGALDYLFTHLKEGEKARVVVCRSFSEFINGQEDVAGALSTDDEIALIKKIAKKKFGKEDKDIEVTDMEKLSHHSQLFEALRGAVDSKTGELDINKALVEDSQEKVEAETSSLCIARQLFKAAKESEVLSEQFRKTMPSRLRGEADETSPARYYSLIEVAVRLGDMLNGRYIQGGSERQAIYDGIMIQLIKGEDGRYRDVEALKPLFPVLSGLRFETLHLDDEKNYYHLKKVQSTARCRMLIYAALLLTAVSGIFETGRIYEQRDRKRRQTGIDEILRPQLNDLQFYETGPYLAIGKENNLEIFNRITNEILEDIKLRYQLPDEACGELRPFLQRFLLDNKNALLSVRSNAPSRIDLADLFVLKHALYFKNKGIETGRPYQRLYGHIPAFRALLASKEDFSFNDSIDPSFSHASGNDLEFIGTFGGGGRYYTEEYEFYLMKKPHDRGKAYLVARDIAKEEYGSGRKAYSSAKAREGVNEFFRMMARYDAISLDRYHRDIWKMQSDDTGAKENAAKCAPKKIEDNESTRWMYRPITYKDFFGGFEYEVINAPTYLDETNETIKCMLARKPGEKFFTQARMLEAVRRYCEAKGEYCL